MQFTWTLSHNHLYLPSVITCLKTRTQKTPQQDNCDPTMQNTLTHYIVCHQHFVWHLTRVKYVCFCSYWFDFNFYLEFRSTNYPGILSRSSRSEGVLCNIQTWNVWSQICMDCTWYVNYWRYLDWLRGFVQIELVVLSELNPYM